MNRLSPSGLYCAYLRKSRRDEELEAMGQGETLARHAQALAGLAQRLGIHIARTYREIVSGDTIRERPEVRRLLEDVNAGTWDGVLVMDVDRLGRGDSIDQGVIMQSFLYSGTLIVTPDKIYDPADDSDAEFFEIKLFFSRREYSMIKKRMQRGTLASVMEGNYVGGRPPFGYRQIYEQGRRGPTLEPVPGKAETVRAMFDWYLAGEGTRTIALRLNAMGVRTERGSPWNPNAVSQILHNPTYIGKIRWQHRRTVYRIEDGRRVAVRKTSDDYILVDGRHPAIVPPEIFDAVQVKIARAPRVPVNLDKRQENPFRGLVICARCGHVMQRRPKKDRKGAALMCPTLGCPTVASYIDVLEEAVLAALSQWCALPVAPRPEDDAPDRAARARELKILDGQRAAVAAQLDRLFDLVEQGVYSVDVFVRRRDQLQARLADIDARAAELRGAARPDPRLALARQAVTVVEAYRAAPDAETKNDLLRTVIDHIVYTKNQQTRRGKDPAAGLTIEIFPRLPEEMGE